MAFDRQCNKIVCPAFAKTIQNLTINLIFGEGFGIIKSQ